MCIKFHYLFLFLVPSDYFIYPKNFRNCWKFISFLKNVTVYEYISNIKDNHGLYIFGYMFSSIKVVVLHCI